MITNFTQMDAAFEVFGVFQDRQTRELMIYVFAQTNCLDPELTIKLARAYYEKKRRELGPK